MKTEKEKNFQQALIESAKKHNINALQMIERNDYLIVLIDLYYAGYVDGIRWSREQLKEAV